MIGEKGSGWYWFCEQYLPNGSKCKAANMKCEDREQALAESSIHIVLVQHKD